MRNNTNFDNNNLPLVVCVSTIERKHNYQWFDGGNQLAIPQISIDTLDELRNKAIILPKDVRENDLLILHPYDTNRYIHIEDVESVMVKHSKFLRYSEILQDLGATSYEVTSIKTTVYKIETDVEGKVSLKKVKTPIDLKVNVNDEEEFKSKMGFRLKDTFQGVHTISEQSFLHAKELVNQYSLQDDEYINTIIRKRDPKKENHNLTEHLYCEAMQEFNKCIDVAAAFNAATVFNLSSNVKHAISQKIEYSLDIDVAFPEQ